MHTTKAILFTGVNEVVCREVQIPEPGPGEVLTETLFTCVSPGTEMRCLSGKQVGTSGWPFIPGYANVGRVVARGAGVTVPVGAVALVGGTQQASCARLWGGHVGMAVQKASEVAVLPAGVDPVAAVIGRLAAIAHHGWQQSRPQPGETVAVVGLGPIGMMSALLHAGAGATVCGFDLFEERVALARSLGLNAVRPSEGLAAAAKQVFPDGADIVVDSTGSAAVLKESVLLGKVPAWGVKLDRYPRLVIQGSYAGDLAMNYQEAFLRDYIIFVPRDQTAYDRAAVLELLRAGKLNLRGLVGEPYRPEDAPEVYRILREQPRQMLTAVFDWS